MRGDWSEHELVRNVRLEWCKNKDIEFGFEFGGIELVCI